jgi:hypothetical protein
MAVTIRNGDLSFLLDPIFVAGHSLDELGAVLEHEVNHVVLGHLEADRASFPDRKARILSEEVTANEFVRGPLPGKPHRLADYGLPPDESTDARYGRLARRHRARKESARKGGNSVQTVSDSVPAGRETEPGGHACGALSGISSLDNHDVWPTAEHDVDVATIVDRILTRAIALTPAAQVPAIVRDRLARSDKSTGRVENLPACSAPASARIASALAWIPKRSANFRKPSRRLPHLVGIVPRMEPARLRIVAAIDTSASMSASLIALVNAQPPLVTMRRLELFVPRKTL